MKYLIFSFLFFVSQLSANDFEAWAERVSKSAPHAIFEFAKSSEKYSAVLKDFSKTKEVAGPFKFPVNDISSVQGDKVVSGGEEQSFGSKKKRITSGYSAVRFKANLDKDSHAIITVNGGGHYRLYLNGRYLDQRLNGLVYEHGSTDYLVKMKKGVNEFVILPSKSKSVNSGLAYVPVSKEIQDEYKAYLIQKFSTLTKENKNEFLSVIDRLSESKNTKNIAEAVSRIINEFTIEKDDWHYINIMRKALTADVFSAVKRKVEMDKLAAIAVQIDTHHIVERLSNLILNEKGNYVEAFLYKCLELCDTEKKVHTFRRNLYEAAKMFSYCGRYNEAHRILGKYRTIMNVNDKHHYKYVEALFIETSDPGKVRPRFVGDPETDHLKREVDTLLAEKPGKEAYQRLLRLFRNKGHQLFEDSDRKLSLRGYLASSLKTKNVYAQGFAAYLKGRYQEDVNEAIASSNVEDLEKILSEVEGLTQFPEARKFLMQEYYNRGLIRKSLRDATFLIKYGKEQSLAAAYILLLEDRLSIPQNSRVSLPESINSETVKIAGKSTKISDLIKKYRTKVFETVAKGPGKLKAQFELAEVSYGSFESYDSDKRSGTLKLNRQPLNGIFYDDKWISASPYGIKVFDKTGKSLWSIKKPIKEAESRGVSIPKSYRSTIIENKLFNIEYAEGSKYLELVARDLKGNEIWSTQTLRGFEKWEPCSLPYSKFNTAVVLLMEKQRTTSPVIGVGFIDLETGNLDKIIPISRTRDPFGHDRRYTDISSIARFHDRFTADEESIYFFTGSGQIIKVDALQENISWVTGYHFRLAGVGHHFSMNLSRAASAAPGFITKSGDKIINFNPARLGWFIINDNDGEVVWKNFTQIPNYIHSRGTSEVIYSTGSDDRRNLLVKMDIQTGKKIWRTDLLGIRVTGEGVISNGKVYVPTVKGIAEFNAETGKLEKISSLRETPTKIKRVNDDWLVQTRYNGFVFASGDKLYAGIKNQQQAKKIDQVKISDTDSLFWRLESAVEFPFNFAKKDRDEEREIFKTSKPGYYIIRIGDDVALFRESSYENRTYSPPQVIWSNSIKEFDVVGDNLLIRYEDRVEVFNVLTRKNIFVYETDQYVSEIVSGMSKVSTARLNNGKVYILTAKQELLVYELNSGKFLNKFRLNASDIIIDGNQLLAISSRSGKYKTALYEVNGQLKLIKEFKEKISQVNLLKSNSKYFGCFSSDRLFILDRESKEVSQYNCSKKTGWRLIGDFAAIAPNMFINLKTKKHKTVKGVYLCENGGAVIIEDKDKVLYLNEKGQTQLENVDSKFKFSSQDPIAKIRDFGRGSDYGDQLILTSFEGERIYSLKDGKLLSSRNWSYSEHNTQFLFTEKSRLVMKHDKAFVFSSLGHQLPLNQLKEGSDDVENLSWVPIKRDSWINIKNSTPLEAYYRYSESSEKVHLQVKLKGALRQVNGVSMSMNAPRYQEYVFAEAMEGRSTFINVSGHVATDDRRNHYYDDNGFEYLEIELDKNHLVNITHNPAVQIEIASYKHSRKTGYFRIGGSFAPGASYLNLNNQPVAANEKQGRYEDLEELYTQASCLLADGLSLSKFIKKRRALKGADDNIRFLESLLKKHKENISSIGILSCLFLEKAHKLQVENKVSDTALISTSKQCRSLANNVQMKKEWIDHALTIFDLEMLVDKNHNSLPSKIGLKGEGEVFIPLDGSIQISAKDGRVLLAPGLFNRSYVFKVKEFEFRKSDYSPLLGEFKLLRDDKFTPITDAAGNPKSDLAQGRFKESIIQTLAYTKSAPTAAYKLNSKTSRLYIKEVVLPRFGAEYKWDAESLLANMKLNPVSEGQATDMLRKWLEINKVSDDKLGEILVEVMTYNTHNYNLIYSVCRILMEKNNDLEMIKSILRKAKINLNFRRRIFLSFADMKKWQELGPIYAAEDVKNPSFEPLPERTRLKAGQEFTDTHGNKFQFKEIYNPKKRNYNNGVVYYTSNFDSKNAGKAYLHIGNSGGDGYGVYTVWFNGKKVTEGSFQRWKYIQSSTMLECRQGTNSLLIKYEFIRSKKFKIKIGDLYGAPVSYIK